MHWAKQHLEWIMLLSGLVLLGLMDPATDSVSFCLFDLAGIEFCPGDGLGHSISYTFRGQIESAIEAHFMGPLAVLIMALRIINRWKEILTNKSKVTSEVTDG